nr:RusA family crossover junction endodeoxyribonuclease [Altibacter sp.]
MIVYIKPIACPRPRVARGRTYYPMQYKKWIKEMKTRLKDLSIPSGPIHVELVFVVQRPKRMKKGNRVIHSKRPDLDNMIKAVLDALPIKDDAVVHSIKAQKFYGATDEDPKIEIMIRSAEIKKSLE